MRLHVDTGHAPWVLLLSEPKLSYAQVFLFHLFPHIADMDLSLRTMLLSVPQADEDRTMILAFDNRYRLVELDSQASKHGDKMR